MMLKIVVDFRYRRTLSAGMASASSSSKLSCGVFRSCYSRWSRHPSLQSQNEQSYITSLYEVIWIRTVEQLYQDVKQVTPVFFSYAQNNKNTVF